MSDTTTDTPRAFISILEHGVNGDIVIRARYGADSNNPVDIVVQPDQFAALIRDLVTRSVNVMDDIASRHRVGDCPTCKNTGMIEEDRHHGKPWLVHCPDCHDRRTGSGFTRYPLIGGGTR